MSGLAPLRDWVRGMTLAVERCGGDVDALLPDAVALLRGLITRDDWLPEACAAPDPAGYRQYLLHCDPLERFCAVSFVWLPGQRTPVHDHTVWGLVGVLRGSEASQAYACDGPSAAMQPGIRHVMRPGDIQILDPRVGDIHVVENAGAETAVSIHVYGGNIGVIRRSVFDPATGAARAFVSGYSAAHLPNPWGGPGDAA